MTLQEEHLLVAGVGLYLLRGFLGTLLIVGIAGLLVYEYTNQKKAVVSNGKPA